MSAEIKACQGQHEELIACTKGAPLRNRAYKLIWQFQTRGLSEAFGIAITRVRRFLTDRGNGTKVVQPGTRSSAEVLNLQPGELVRVKSESEILKTLDSCGRNRGLAWIPCMRKYCGQECRVYKRVERIILETTGEIRRAKNTVLLEGVICEGLYGCDRSCFPFWREVWLERVRAGEDDGVGASAVPKGNDMEAT